VPMLLVKPEYRQNENIDEKYNSIKDYPVAIALAQIGIPSIWGLLNEIAANEHDADYLTVAYKTMTVILPDVAIPGLVNETINKQTDEAAHQRLCKLYPLMPTKNSNTERVKEIFALIAEQSKEFSEAAKSVQDRSVYEKLETIDHVSDAFERRYRTLILFTFYFERLKDLEQLRLEKIDAAKLRPLVLTEWLAFGKVLNESFDEDILSVPAYTNISPMHDFTFPGFSGMDPKQINDPDIRKDYEERIAKNQQLIRERRIQSLIQRLLKDTLGEVEKFVGNAYGRAPRADQELIDLLEKHDYPEEERGKLLAAVKLPDSAFYPPIGFPAVLLSDKELVNDGKTVRTVTELTETIPKIVAIEPFDFSEKTDNRWKTVVAVNAVVIVIIAALWFFFKRRNATS